MILSEIVKLHNVFTAHGNDTLSPQTAYKIAKFLSSTQCELATYQSQQANAANRNAVKNENGETVTHDGWIEIKAESIEAFRSEMEAIDTVETGVSIKLTDAEINELKPTVNEMTVLLSCIDGEYGAVPED